MSNSDENILKSLADEIDGWDPRDDGAISHTDLIMNVANTLSFAVDGRGKIPREYFASVQDAIDFIVSIQNACFKNYYTRSFNAAFPGYRNKEKK